MDISCYKELQALEDRHWWFIGRRAITAEAIAKISLPPNSKILELGCGSGGNLTMLSQFGSVSAAEWDPAARQAAEAKGVARVAYCHLPDHFPFEGERFDLIAMLDVLEHIQDDQAALARVRDHISDSGWLLVAVPAFPFLWSVHDARSHHYRRYTRRLLRSRLQEAGFVVRRMAYFNSLLFPAIAAFRLAKLERDSDLFMPPRPINAFLAWLFSLERHAIGCFPFGVSLIATAQLASPSPARPPRL